VKGKELACSGRKPEVAQLRRVESNGVPHMKKPNDKEKGLNSEQGTMEENVEGAVVVVVVIYEREDKVE
jgi:hypothetical protein